VDLGCEEDGFHSILVSWLPAIGFSIQEADKPTPTQFPTLLQLIADCNVFKFFAPTNVPKQTVLAAVQKRQITPAGVDFDLQALIVATQGKIDKYNQAQAVPRRMLRECMGEEFLQELEADPLWAQAGTDIYESKYITTQKSPSIRELAGQRHEVARLALEYTKLLREQNAGLPLDSIDDCAVIASQVGHDENKIKAILEAYEQIKSGKLQSSFGNAGRDARNQFNEVTPTQELTKAPGNSCLRVFQNRLYYFC
jgi:hypothetical protein